MEMEMEEVGTGCTNPDGGVRTALAFSSVGVLLGCVAGAGACVWFGWGSSSPSSHSSSASHSPSRSTSSSHPSSSRALSSHSSGWTSSTPSSPTKPTRRPFVTSLLPRFINFPSPCMRIRRVPACRRALNVGCVGFASRNNSVRRRSVGGTPTLPSWLVVSVRQVRFFGYLSVVSSSSSVFGVLRLALFLGVFPFCSFFGLVLVFVFFVLFFLSIAPSLSRILSLPPPSFHSSMELANPLANTHLHEIGRWQKARRRAPCTCTSSISRGGVGQPVWMRLLSCFLSCFLSFLRRRSSRLSSSFLPLFSSPLRVVVAVVKSLAQLPPRTLESLARVLRYRVLQLSTWFCSASPSFGFAPRTLRVFVTAPSSPVLLRTFFFIAKARVFVRAVSSVDPFALGGPRALCHGSLLDSVRPGPGCAYTAWTFIPFRTTNIYA
ncbi:hypothetical protein FA13DRAFT_1102405 [Coprinellus micaceus]|uniref:Uncharacterized protein n=1 Tax=Coprinellus micaceus TaxID=71717 RepID=A0A4Y7SYG7_COPMI|nr:hypothetical protein FA13DRAFT_1102405 [Coprinellus micaceus]